MTSRAKSTDGKEKNQTIREKKELLFKKLASGEISLGGATKSMRNIVGLTQKEYAEKILKIYPRVLMDIENDRGNPTLETLQKIAKPFGLKVGFVRVQKEEEVQKNP
ncbi:MAG: helix-turn-helix transcriptional regulator [Desulfuromonadaceae bacterium]|nr:helix-turn-helix transcriptional regulator [Desulfuromonadaceae bacterium]MDD2849634.1 helix-turn-helix transcriptional regulator [Desulfuromonadaceae bacterium]MDD4130907.1 helix-turn-helix transcriptional regulator [Desulfuromonadaceae bacterium]